MKKSDEEAVGRGGEITLVEMQERDYMPVEWSRELLTIGR